MFHKNSKGNTTKTRMMYVSTNKRIQGICYVSECTLFACSGLDITWWIFGSWLGLFTGIWNIWKMHKQI